MVPGRTFLRRLFNSKIGPARPFIHINSHIKADLLWWHHFLPLWNGIHIISPSRPLLRLWTDASGDFGIGAYILQGGQTTHTLPAEQVVSERYTTRLRAKHINEKEMTAILHAIRRWLPMCKGAHLLLYCDSFAVMSGVKKTSIRGGAMHPLRNIAMMAAIYDIEIEPHWLSTKENFLADWLSRGLFGKIADNYPTQPAGHFIEQITASLARDPPETWYNEVPLDRQAARYLWWGIAIRTRGLYDAARKSYTTYCQLATNFPPFPATIRSLSAWIAALGQRGLRPKTIKNYLAGVRSSQLDMGLGDLEVFHHPVLDRIIAGIKRMHGEPERRERLPITRNILIKLLRKLDTTNEVQATLHAAYSIAFS